MSPQLPESSAKGIVSRAAGRAASFPRCPPLLTPSREGSDQGGEARPYSKGRVTLSWGMSIPNFHPPTPLSPGSGKQDPAPALPRCSSAREEDGPSG